MNRFYGELASWWPLISPAEEYVEEAAFAASVLSSAAVPVREVLELGSGGGHNAVHLKNRFELTLVDISPAMLEMSHRLNPECEHHLGDMRSVRLGREFDAVFVHDAIDYMTTEADLRLAIETAFTHCRPGRAPRPVSRLGLGSRPDRHLDPDRVRLPAPRPGRLRARRTRNTPHRPVRTRHLAPAAERRRVLTAVGDRVDHRGPPPAHALRRRPLNQLHAQLLEMLGIHDKIYPDGSPGHAGHTVHKSQPGGPAVRKRSRPPGRQCRTRGSGTSDSRSQSGGVSSRRVMSLPVAWSSSRTMR
jgi:SAM-dependent methyltransferase